MTKAIMHLYNGEKRTLKEISELSGVSLNAIRWRMRHLHLTAQEAVETRSKYDKWFYKGRYCTASEIARDQNIKLGTLSQRLRSNVPLDIAVSKGYIRYPVHYGTYGLGRIDAMNIEELRERAAKKIFGIMMFEKLEESTFTQQSPTLYTFDSESIQFYIEFDDDIVDAWGALKSNGNTLIRRRYKLVDNRLKEVPYG